MAAAPDISDLPVPGADSDATSAPDISDLPFPAQSSHQAYDPTDGMSTGEKVAAGAGKFLVDTGRGSYQLGASIGHAMGMVSDEKMQQIQQDADDRKKEDQPLMDTGAGTAGYIGGGIASMLAAPELAGAAAPAKLAAMVPKFAKMPVVADTLMGAGSSALQPTATGESRLENTAEGALGGAGGSLAGKAVGWMAQPVRSALSTAGKSAVETLQKAGIPLDLAQQSGTKFATILKNVIADNPFIGQSALPEEQGKVFNRAVLKTMGIDDPSVSVADDTTLAHGRKAITDVMHDVADRNPIQYDGGLEQDLARIGDEAPGTLTANDMGPVYSNLENIMKSAAQNKGVIPGNVYRKLRSNLGILSKDGKYAPIMGDIQEALDDAFQRSTSPEDVEALKTARRQYRAMKQIEGAIDPATNSISPGKLLGQINTKSNRNQSLYGQGDQELVKLAKAAKNVLAPHNPDSGTARRLAGLAAVGAIAGTGDELLHGDPSEALRVGAMGVAAPWAARKVIENPTLVKGVMKWNNSPLIKGATDATRRTLATGAPSAIDDHNEQQMARASGGRVSHDALVDRLIGKWKSAKRATDATTKPLLNVPDPVIVKALDIAQSHL